MPAARYAKVIKQVREAGELARSGALSLDDGVAAIYFLWGQPSHAYIRDGDEVVEGDEALKQIAILLAQPGKIQWKAKDVIQKETLRTNGEDLIRVLEELSQAGTASPDVGPVTTDVWDGSERRRPEAFSYNLAEFPMLPAGAPLWSEVPISVVHLDVLLASLPSVLITLDAPGVRAAGVVFQSELNDALWVDSDGAVLGREAWERIMGCQEGTVSAYELDDRLAEALPILWRSRIVFRDLDKRWFDAHRFTDTLGSGGEDRALIVATHTKVGIALILRGELAGAWTSTNRASNPLIEDVLDMLLESAEGAVSVIERLPDDVAEPFPMQLPVEAPQQEPATTPESRPEWLEWAAEPAGQAPEIVPAQPVSDVRPAPPTEHHEAAEKVETPTSAMASADREDFGLPSALPEAATPASAPEPTVETAVAGGPQPLFALAESVAAPAEGADDDVEVLVGELIVMGTERLGPEFAAMSYILENAERSAPGLRQAIGTLRTTALPGHDQQEVSDVGRLMLGYVADRVSGS